MVEMLAIQSFKDVAFDPPPADPKAFLLAILNNRYQVAEEYGHIMA